MTQENERGELIGYPAKESELQSSNLTNIGSSNLYPTPDTTPTENPASDLVENPVSDDPAENPTKNPTKNPAENPTSNYTKKAPLLFIELRKLRKPGKGI